MMDGHEKSDSAIVAGKSSNKAGQPAAETMELRAEAKKNAKRDASAGPNLRWQGLPRVPNVVCSLFVPILGLRWGVHPIRR